MCPINGAGAQYTASAVACEEANPAHMMRHNEDGLVRQMCDTGAIGAAYIVNPAFVLPPRMVKQSATRLV